MLSISRQERQVVVFFAVIVTSGIGINYLAKSFTVAREVAFSAQMIGKVDLNRADQLTLESVTGIGEKLAARIIGYRKEKGRFNDVGELCNIRGITRYRYEKIKEYFFVE